METRNEKALNESVIDHEVHTDDDSDASSEPKQAGVKQVEAVTQAWSPAMMWLVFTLSVYRIHAKPKLLTLRLSDSTLLHSWTLSYRRFTAVW